jgi:hypothetical protein
MNTTVLEKENNEYSAQGYRKTLKFEIQTINSYEDFSIM